MPISSQARLTSVLVASSVVPGTCAILAASSSVADSSSARGSTRFTRPISRASSARSVWPVYRYSDARFQFMKSQGSIMVSLPGSPQRTLGIWKVASSDASVMSVSSAQ